MNNSTRMQIARKTDEQLESDIALYSRQLAKTGRNLRSIRISQRARLNAHMDEFAARITGGTAVYG